MRAVHFGAGNIGKGFIGYFLNKTGYEVCFVDVDQKAVDQFNKNNRYLVEILDDARTVESISPVSALNSLTQSEEVIEGIENADIITTSVGVNNLSRIAPVLLEGLRRRIKKNKNKLDIIANENAINASSTLRAEIEKLAAPGEMDEILTLVSFPNSSIDRLALSRECEQDQIAIVEPVYEWVINQTELINPELPLIEGATYVGDLKPYIERKLFVVNMGHATTAYMGYLYNESTIQSALKRPEIEQVVRGAMNEAAQYFIKKYNVSQEEMKNYIEKTIIRFKNQNISDNIFRVGRSPIRKLGYHERLVRPMRELSELGLQSENLVLAISAGFIYDNPQDEESVRLQAFIREHGIEEAIQHFTGITDDRIISSLKEHYFKLKVREDLPSV
ncbi:mannitol-1-phosphate 5-dehydrogenase [Falsibacillus pallidus]|uniref:Mannitol-1-phosphate 5-dehydrogenase n=1 Tax=Falsibacillus pallidus TaxID=493781 RepID=A0A370GEF0_9BACI|nr:mannitol-1-phosphate 5-dehydrogenase [Falsibacillus pallidus]RDI41630.1 mannitol-1-phosphate 5-dehydrogenase [Falsibacillus pallidus]